MHPDDIKAHIGKAGSSQTAIAQAQQVSVSAVWSVIHGFSASRAIAQRISKVTGVPLATLWPQRYGKPSGRAATKPARRTAKA